MNPSSRLLALYQIVAGASALVLLAGAAFGTGFVCGTVLVIASLLNIYAGVLLWTQELRGWRWTALSQGIQCVGLYVPSVAICIVQGASVVTNVRYFQKASFAESLFQHNIGIWVSPTCDAILGSRPASLPTYGLSVNWLAVGLVALAVCRIRKANQGVRPSTSLSSVSAHGMQTR